MRNEEPPSEFTDAPVSLTGGPRAGDIPARSWTATFPCVTLLDLTAWSLRVLSLGTRHAVRRPAGWMCSDTTRTFTRKGSALLPIRPDQTP